MPKSTESTRKLYAISWVDPNGPHVFFGRLGPQESKSIFRMLEEAAKVEMVNVELVEPLVNDFQWLREEIRQRYY